MKARQQDEEPWLRDVRRKYIANADRKLAALQAAVDRLAQSPGDPRHRHTLRTLLHNLVGSGASYGFPKVSVVARRLSSLLKRADDERMITQSDLISILNNGLRELRQTFDAERSAVLGNNHSQAG